MKINITMKMTEDSDDGMGFGKGVTFTVFNDDPCINVCMYDEDTSESVEMNISKSELMKVLSILRVSSVNTDFVEAKKEDTDNDCEDYEEDECINDIDDEDGG